MKDSSRRQAAAFLILLAVPFLPPTAAAENLRREGEHVIVEWGDGNASPEAVEAAMELGETYFAAISGMLGHGLDRRIVILLQGAAERPDGSRGYPRVDVWGRILLYRFGPTHHSYFSALAHEMVHVFRIDRRPHFDMFFEEGLAEMVALRVDDSREGFPWYGFPVDLVAGQWIARGKEIPLAELRERHEDLNLPCKAQAYALRSSFFDWLGRARGDEAVVAMASEKRAGRLEDYEKHFGADFDELAAAWREETLDAYRAIQNADDPTEEYLRSPIRYMDVCGGD